MFIHGYLLMEGQKMSKSLGNVLDPFEVIERFGADALRYYCFREVSFGQDGSVSAAGFEARYETELANEYGNLASRTLAMIERYRDGVVPEAEPDPELAGGEDGLAGLEARVARAAGPRRADPGAGGDLGAGAPPEPLRRGDPPLGPGQGRRRRPSGWTSGALQPRRGPARASPCCCYAVHARDRGPAADGARRGGARAGRVRVARRRPARSGSSRRCSRRSRPRRPELARRLERPRS